MVEFVVCGLFFVVKLEVYWEVCDVVVFEYCIDCDMYGLFVIERSFDLLIFVFFEFGLCDEVVEGLC